MPIDGNGITIKETLEKGIKLLNSAQIGTPALEAGVMLCNVLNCDKAYLYCHSENLMPNGSLNIYLSNIEKRITGIPLQHITGSQEFMSLAFKVSKDVLIPRQDTEVLVEAVIRYANESGKKNIRILDIGTGSGCIAVSLAYYIKSSTVTAIDISQGALDIAMLNAENNGVSNKICYIQSNLFENLSDCVNSDGGFDIIVSNPPYINSDDINNLQIEVKCHEPLTALDGGLDGLDFYKSITGTAPSFLSPGGILAFEVGYNQSIAVKDLMEKEFSEIKILKDLSNIERVVIGRLKKRQPILSTVL